MPAKRALTKIKGRKKEAQKQKGPREKRGVFSRSLLEKNPRGIGPNGGGKKEGGKKKIIKGQQKTQSREAVFHAPVRECNDSLKGEKKFQERLWGGGGGGGGGGSRPMIWQRKGMEGSAKLTSMVRRKLPSRKAVDAFKRGLKKEQKDSRKTPEKTSSSGSCQKLGEHNGIKAS